MVGRNLVERLAPIQSVELLTPGRRDLNLLNRQKVAKRHALLKENGHDIPVSVE
jgi:hypothetical protein